VDASAVLAWVFDERGSDAVDKVLSVSVLSAVNLAEVLYRCDEDGMNTNTLKQDLVDLGVHMEPFTPADADVVMILRRASRRQNLRLSLADCCCLATADRLNLPVVGGDKAWEVLDTHLRVEPFR
jgi:PIN domain nuclease of toxin-antitoxin system